MYRVFLSHSSRDNRAAIAVKASLIDLEPGLAEEIFLDLDPHTGIRPGERWKQALQQANERCEAVICLLSKHWNRSHECAAEYRHAETLKKTILCARLEPLPDTGITSEWQRCDLFADHGPTTEIEIGDGGAPVVLSSQGLQRLLRGLGALGIGAEHFRWPPPGDPDRAPYRGWAALEEADAAVFFGRDAQILRGLEELREMRTSGVQSLLVILGPSGAGKSSFLRAGLLPRLRRDDRRFLPLPIVRPETAVLTGEHGFAHAIYRLRADLGLRGPMPGEIKTACHPEQVERLWGWLTEAQVARPPLLDVPADEPPPTLVVPLDQAEELFSADAGPEAPRFLELLASLVRHEAGVTPVMLVALTIRADRYEPLQIAPQLAGVHSVVFDELKPMPPAGYTEVITGPARRASAGPRLTIEPALVERLQGDATESADALPLLALTLERLYRDFGADGDLTLAEYEAMGGMAEVVQTEIETVLGADPEQRRARLELLHDVFIPWLATINPGNDQPMRRLARWDNLPPAGRSLIQAMVERRLLVKDTRDGEVVVEVALESLLRQWDELAAWLREETQDLKDADALERAAADWQASGRDQSWLPGGTRLLEAERLAAKSGFRDRLDPTREYLHASRERENDTIARFREATGLRLVFEAQPMLAGARPGGAVRAYQQLLAGRRLAQTPDDGPLVNALVKMVNLIKVADAGAPVSSVAFSPDGTRIVSGCKDATVRLWDAATGQSVGEPLTGHTGAVSSVAFSPDGTRLASGSDDQTVRLWDAATGQPVGDPLIGHTGPVWGVAFSPDGTRLASGSDDQTVRVWDAATGQPVGDPLTGHTGTVQIVAFSPDGTRLASGGADQKVRVWDAATGQPVGDPLTGHTGAVWGVAFSPDGTRLASGSADQTVRLWDPGTGQPVSHPLTGHTGTVWSVAFSPDGTRLASAGYDQTVRVWDPGTGEPVGHPLTGHTGTVSGVAFSPDSTRLASGSYDGTLRIWDPGTRQPVGHPLTGHTDRVTSVAFSPDGTRLASGSDDQTVRLWDAATGHPAGARVTGHTSRLDCVAFSPDGTRLACGGADGTVWLWDAATGEPVVDPLTGHTGAVWSVAFSPDGTRLACGGTDGTLRLWDAATGEPVVDPLTGHTGGVQSVAFSPDGTRIASGSWDTAVRLWDAATGQPVGHPLTGHTDAVWSVAFSPDGTRLATGSFDRMVRLWDPATGQPVGHPLTGHTDRVTSVAFSPDGTRIASASYDNTVRVWDAATGQPVGDPLTGHTGTVTSVALSPDGTHIASGGDDNTVRLWPTYPDPASALCAKLTTNMNHQQWNEWVSPDIDYITVCPDLPPAR